MKESTAIVTERPSAAIARLRANLRRNSYDQSAREEGCGPRPDARSIPDEQFDLICFFDCLHDMGDPVGAIRRAAEVLAQGGSALIVEPMAGNTVAENFNPIGCTFAAASTLCCTSNSLALNGPALGAVAPEEAIRDTVVAGGLKQFRRATETPFNRVFEARH